MNTIPGNELRDQLLQRLKDGRNTPPQTIETIMTSREHARLLRLISDKKPDSIAALYEVTKDDHTSVSLRLSNLVRSGLVHVVNKDDKSEPMPTRLGVLALSRLTPHLILNM